MIHSNTSRPLSEAFYQKLVRAVEGSADRDAFVWNQEGSGVLLLDEGALEDVLMTLFSIHLQTFRKMMMMYGFRKTISEVGEEQYIHPDLLTRKLSRRQSENRGQKDERTQQQQEQSAQRRIKRQEIAAGRLRELSSCIRGTFAKADSLSQSIKQRGKLAEKMLDAMMFRLLARQDSEGSDRQSLFGSIATVRELVKRNEQDVRQSLTLLQDELRNEQDICGLIREQRPQQTPAQQQQRTEPLHFLTEPQIKMQMQNDGSN